MVIDYKQELLESLWEEYKSRGAELTELYRSEDYTLEYGKGGERIQRGYYCPSPVIDMLVGNINRGRLLKRHPKPGTYDWLYYKDQTGRLVAVDTYTDFFKKTEHELYEREVLFYSQTYVIAAKYSVFRDNPRRTLSSLSYCDYHDNRIIRYLFMFGKRSTSSPNDTGGINGEEYIYDQITGRMIRASIGTCFITNEGVKEYVDSYRLNHSADGVVVSFQMIKRDSDGNEILCTPCEISKSKQRRV